MNDSKASVWDRWLDPSNVIALAKALGVLFLLALGGYVWLLKLEWKIDEELVKTHSAVTAINVHNAEAETWKRRIILAENRLTAHENAAVLHSGLDSHVGQGRATAVIQTKIQNLEAAIRRLENAIKEMKQSQASLKHPALLSRD